MPAFEPFRAVRYAATHDLARLTAPPYDVLSDADVDELAARDPHNVVRVDVPRGGDERYSEAAVTLNDWLATGDLVTDVEPTFTIYRRRFTDATGQERELSGVLGALEVVDEGSGEVLAHERTTPKASTDRLELIRATHSNLSPVWCLSAYPGLSALLDAPGEPVGTVTVDGVEHVVERVSDPARISEIRSAVASTPALIADGHHRYAVSRQYRDERRAEGGDPGAELTLAFVGELVADQLSVEAIHRLYTGIEADALADALSERFDIEPAVGDLTPEVLGRMNDDARLVLVRPGGWDWLVPKPGAFDGLRALDGLWLEETLADSTAEVTYQHGLDQSVAAVRGGEATAAVLIRPVSVEEIRRTAEEGLLMPPKSTYFTPKLRTGLVIRDLGSG
ncbi:MAG TPA: DUF1015 domain-containing protein [Lapillicoccus sp.]|uniref:DUF1015 domain-containing protein n=1 Tax=Lapillicoccus sp. TaxID=1909287 RepID=UPI002F94BAE0